MTNRRERSRAIMRELLELDGLELDSALDRYAVSDPDIVSVAGVDDTHFASSSLTFVRTFLEEDDSQHGAWAFYVGQLDGEQARFYVYPGHADSITRALEQAFGSGS